MNFRFGEINLEIMRQPFLSGETDIWLVVGRNLLFYVETVAEPEDRVLFDAVLDQYFFERDNEHAEVVRKELDEGIF